MVIVQKPPLPPPDNPTLSFYDPTPTLSNEEPPPDFSTSHLLPSPDRNRFTTHDLRVCEAPRPNHGTFARRNWSLVTLSIFACGMFMFTSYFAHKSTDLPRDVQSFHGSKSNAEPRPPLDLGGTPRSIFFLQVCAWVTAFLLAELSIECYGRVRWHHACALSGVSGGTLLGLSRATSILGVFILLIGRSASLSTRLWCLKRLTVYAAIGFISFVFLLNLHFSPFYPVYINDLDANVVPGWGDFDFNQQQSNPSGFTGFLSDTRSSFRISPAAERCYVTNDTTLEDCASYLIPTSIFYLGFNTPEGATNLSITPSSIMYSALFGSPSSTAVSGFMPWIETPWALSFYPYAYGYVFTDEECGIWRAPAIFYPPNYRTVSANGGEVALKMCFSTLGPDQGLQSATTILGQISVCGGRDSQIGSCSNHDTSGFTGAGTASDPFNLSMTVTKWYASPLYDFRNGSIMNIDLPFYEYPTIMESNVPHPPNPSAPIPVSISAQDFRNFMFAPYDGEHGNLADVHSVSNVLINNMVQLISQSNSDLAYTYVQDLLAYSLRSGSTFPAAAPYNATVAVWGWSQYRLVISYTSFIIFVVLGATVLLSCLAIVVWAAAWDTGTMTTFYPEVDFAAGFASHRGSDSGREQVAILSGLLYKDSFDVADKLGTARFRVVGRGGQDEKP